MKDKIINVKTIIIIVLIGIIISMFFIVLNMKNKSIVGQEIEKEQLGETSTDNAYITLEAHNLELKEKQQEINNMQNTAGKATVTVDKILKDYTAYKNGQLITGTMANNGAVTKTLNAGASYTIPAGYHNGNGKVTANSLASQTQATATASDILSGKTAWVNGKLVTGNSSLQTISENITVIADYFNERSVGDTFSAVLDKGEYLLIVQNGYYAYSEWYPSNPLSVSGATITETIVKDTIYKISVQNDGTTVTSTFDVEGSGYGKSHFVIAIKL